MAVCSIGLAPAISSFTAYGTPTSSTSNAQTTRVARSEYLVRGWTRARNASAWCFSSCDSPSNRDDVLCLRREVREGATPSNWSIMEGSTRADTTFAIVDVAARGPRGVYLLLKIGCSGMWNQREILKGPVAGGGTVGSL